MQLVPLFISLLCFAVHHHAVWAIRERTFELEITREDINPDCHSQSFPHLLVNGQFPAPPIRVTKDDLVHIIVRNNIGSGDDITLHYHGILQLGSNEADGVPGITQQPIAPGEEYHQRFQVRDQAGTYHYHAHVGLHDDSVVGPFIVYASEDAWPDNECEYTATGRKLRDGPHEYDDERVLLLQEYWHMTDEDRMAYYMGPNFEGILPADNYLINGCGVSDASDSSCGGYPVFNVQPNTVYRLRVIGGVSAAMVSINLHKHSFTIIEVDGNLVAPYPVAHLEVAPGQRLSVLLHTLDAAEGESFFINAAPLYSPDSKSTGRAIVRYSRECQKHQSASAAAASVARTATDPTVDGLAGEIPQWVYPNLAPIENPSVDMTAPPDRTIVIRPSQRVLADGSTHWFLNDRLQETRDTPLLEYVAQQSSAERQNMLSSASAVDGYNANLGSYVSAYNEVIDLVIETVTIPDGNCIGHPWHTHGMIHHVLAAGPGAYDHQRDKDLRTFPNPTIARDTTLVYPVQPAGQLAPAGQTCGWTKIRIRTTNPGAWVIHCHVTSHMLQGMILSLVAAPDRIASY